MDPAEFYTGIVVEVYARLRSATFDPEPYVRFVREIGEPALEIGCGDGDPMLAVRALGIDVEGVDSSPDMLRRCRERAAGLGIDVIVHHQRMEELQLERRFAAVYLAGPTFNLLPDDDTALRALRAIGAHLADGGRARVPLWIPDPTPAEEIGATRQAIADDGATLRYVVLGEHYDRDARTRTTRTRYEREPAAGGEVEVVQRDWVLHWHTPAGFASLCERAGLEVLSLLDDDGRPAAASASDFVALLAPAGRR